MASARAVKGGLFLKQLLDNILCLVLKVILSPCGEAQCIFFLVVANAVDAQLFTEGSLKDSSTPEAFLALTSESFSNVAMSFPSMCNAFSFLSLVIK